MRGRTLFVHFQTNEGTPGKAYLTKHTLTTNQQLQAHK